uniref:Uncharacterized protein n=1 Tax=Oryza nivara TaxID=4536 RepID=A0A0E0I1L3_ORYNI
MPRISPKITHSRRFQKRKKNHALAIYSAQKNASPSPKRRHPPDPLHLALNDKSSPFSSVGEERVPDPKPRRNPRPEQNRILEAIFNSGMVNPPRRATRSRASACSCRSTARSATPTSSAGVQPQQQLVSPVGGGGAHLVVVFVLRPLVRVQQAREGYVDAGDVRDGGHGPALAALRGVPPHQQMLYQGQPLESTPAPAPKWPQSPCLSAVDLGAAITTLP